MHSMQTIGLDVGGVIIDVPTRITQELWETLKARPDADILPVAPLVQMQRILRRFQHVYLVSAATDPEMQARILSWLEHWKFWEVTGIPKDHIYFCRSASEKGNLCRKLKLSPHVFLDDTPQALESLGGIVPQRFFFDRLEGEEPPPWAHRVESWDQFERQLQIMRR